MPGLGNIFKSLNPFSRIERRLEQIMAAIDDLKAALDAIQTSLNNVATDVDQLLVLVQAPAPDLTAIVAQAQGIRDQLASVDAKFPTTQSVWRAYLEMALVAAGSGLLAAYVVLATLASRLCG